MAAQYQAEVVLERIVAVSHEELVSGPILLLPVLICPDRLVRNLNNHQVPVMF